MIVETTHNLNRKSWTMPIALAELVLAVLLYFFPDTAKVFLFGLPIVLLFGEAVGLTVRYFKRNGNILHLLGGLLLAVGGGFAVFAGRKTFMLGIAVLMLFETVRFFIFSKNKDNKFLEKLIYSAAALLSLLWMTLILFKGLHLYWSVREYLALYFAGSAFLSIFSKR